MSRRTLAVLALAAVAAACSLERLRRDEAVKDQQGLLAGAVVTPSGSTANVVAALFAFEGGEPRLAGRDTLTDLVHSYAFLVTAGRPYAVVAFQDLDGDLVWDAGEPVGSLRDASPVTTSPRQVLAAPETVLKAGASPPAGYPLDVSGVAAEDGSDLKLSLGDVASLDEPRFAPERGEDAMWTSLAAMRSTGFGLYFLQPYDPRRVPVVFVHGIAGSPRDFKDTVAALDATRFQAWVFQYPSGLRLAYSAEMLGRALERLHESLGFDTAALVAHSMGGLVARGALQRLDGRPGGAGFVSTFVTLATPWLGHESAPSGLKWLDAPVPAWIDMAPGSDYLRSLRQPLPPGIAYHLLFGFGGGRSLLQGEANDGVVTVSSQLAPFAQAEAVRAWGYDLDHMAILSDPEPLARLAAILAPAATGRPAGSEVTSRGGGRADDSGRAAGRVLRIAIVLIAGLGAAAARGQDADVDPFLLALERHGSIASAHATTYQIYRVPLSYTLRETGTEAWGLAVTFPVSLGANELTASTGVGDFFERIQTLTVAPGFELRIPLGRSWLLKPYTEAGFRGTSVGGSADTTLTIGTRAVGAWRPGAAAVTLGLSARYASPRTNRDLIEDYSSFEAGLDVQGSLGFSVAGHAMSGGVYGVTRYFPDFRLTGAPDVSLAWAHEVGISVSAAPTLSALGVEVPWIGLGYRFGDAFSGVRLNLSFPF